MLVRINRDTETIAPFKGIGSFDPGAKFEDRRTHQDLIENALLDPGLVFEKAGLTIDQLALASAQRALTDTLRQQQYIVYDIASQVGVLSSFVGVTQNALQAFDVILTDLDPVLGTLEVLSTTIGTAGQALSAIPTIYTEIVGALAGASAWLANMLIHGPLEIPGQLPVQAYNQESDLGQFNLSVRDTMSAAVDWTSIFSPRFEGALAGQVRTDPSSGLTVVAFAPGDGEIVRVDVEGVGKNRHPVFLDDGQFGVAGGLGMVPGGQRIFSVVQVTPTEEPVGPSTSHPTLYDPRCGSIEKANSIDVGSWYPVTTQGAVSLWDFVWQRGAAMYTIDPVRARGAWKNYFDSIWDGVDRTWGKNAWLGSQKRGDYGWGCGFWENALQDLIANYTVSVFDGQIGGTLSWRPSNIGVAQVALSSKDEKNWNKLNAFSKIIEPALDQLEEAQIWYLENTTIAAYLPIDGGANADPLDQGDRGPMGAFAGSAAMRERFNHARNRILNGPAKYDVRLRDVLDSAYRAQIKSYGGGTQAPELGFTLKMLGEPEPFRPEGGSGLLPRAPIDTIHPQPSPRRSWPFIAGGMVTGATALSYFFWDDLARIVGAARQAGRLR